MSRSENIKQVETLVEQFNSGDLESIRRMFSRDYFVYSPPEEERSAAEQFFELASQLKAAAPDLSVEMDDLRQDGDLLRANLNLNGTHENGLWGLPGSGRHVSWKVNVALRSDEKGVAVKFENVTLPSLNSVLREIGFVNSASQMDQPLPFPVSLPESILQALFNGGIAPKECGHLDHIKVIEPGVDVCEQCVASGDVWPALRMCLTCGFVGCCDTSRNKHTKQHYETTGHPIYRSVRLNERWLWCYEDNAFLPGRTLDAYA